MSRTQTASRTPSLRLASLATCADQAEVSVRTLRRYISSGQLTGYRIGPRMLRIDLNELEALFRPIPAAGSASLKAGEVA